MLSASDTMRRILLKDKQTVERRVQRLRQSIGKKSLPVAGSQLPLTCVWCARFYRMYYACERMAGMAVACRISLMFTHLRIIGENQLTFANAQLIKQVLLMCKDFVVHINIRTPLLFLSAVAISVVIAFDLLHNLLSSSSSFCIIFYRY